MIQVTSDWSDVDRELDRLSRMPTMEATSLLNTALSFSFALTEAAVHVETGALKASGRMETNKQSIESQWTGEITYGDEQAVDYAIYEQRRDIHWVGPSDSKGDHNFLRPLDAVGPVYVAAILEALS